MPEGADRSGELADANLLRGCVETSEVALHLGIPVEQLESEGGGLGVDPVRAADDGGVLELEGPLAEHLGEAQQVFAQDGRCCLELQSLSGVDHVGRGESVMQPARLRPHFSATAVVKAMTRGELRPRSR